MLFVFFLRWDTGVFVFMEPAQATLGNIEIPCVLLVGILYECGLVVTAASQPSYPVTEWKQRNRKPSGGLRLTWGDQRMEADGTLYRWY